LALSLSRILQAGCLRSQADFSDLMADDIEREFDCFSGRSASASARNSKKSSLAQWKFHTVLPFLKRH